MSQGWIIRFDEETNNPYFNERTFVAKRYPPKVPLPYWAICEPFIRSKLVPDDKLFFVPKGTDFVKGVMVVLKNLTGKEAKELFGEKWYQFYKTEVCEHGGVPRGGNVIIGDLTKSFWTGTGVDLHQFASFLPAEVFDSKRQKNMIPKFTDEDQVEKLYQSMYAVKSEMEVAKHRKGE